MNYYPLFRVMKQWYALYVSLYSYNIDDASNHHQHTVKIESQLVATIIALEGEKSEKFSSNYLKKSTHCRNAS